MFSMVFNLRKWAWHCGSDNFLKKNDTVAEISVFLLAARPVLKISCSQAKTLHAVQCFFMGWNDYYSTMLAQHRMSRHGTRGTYTDFTTWSSGRPAFQSSIKSVKCLVIDAQGVAAAFQNTYMHSFSFWIRILRSRGLVWPSLKTWFLCLKSRFF